ncbi:SFL1 [Cyberlindnera jadinii]|uniref:Heat shock transcription factor n=1 Tax=Cyberlindnera jadinii (strain ATCC 18201 / CBS 1600 / BCRC 20928 / JCM 3617 / NBRC 0987 / NRRL Y-1542) TaxID=983966 RepID=A0A0H5BXZ3_CYBJN|nr:SFL1 [Cyberlindnera jadinii]
MTSSAELGVGIPHHDKLLASTATDNAHMKAQADVEESGGRSVSTELPQHHNRSSSIGEAVSGAVSQGTNVSQKPSQIGQAEKHSSKEQTKARKDSSSSSTSILPPTTKGLHTVFIHKLYNMLEDDDLKHLIWWSGSNESFIIVPSEEFSKALSQYFKHTNVASFVRQLNMYGFHKVGDGNSGNNNDQNINPDITTWEFKHSSGCFRKGDIDGLKSIKRRSSKNPSTKGYQQTSQALEAGTGSDSEITSSERSNSAVELQDSYVDPMLNVRLAELGHNLAALRHEHARLQLRYNTTMEDLKTSNMDLVNLLDLTQRLVTVQIDQPSHNGASLKQEENESPRKVRLSNDLEGIQNGLSRLRASILQRAAAKEQFDHFSTVSFAPPAPHPPAPPVAVHQQAGHQQNPPYPAQFNAYPYPYPGPQYQVVQVPPPQANEAEHIVHDPFSSERKASRTSNRSRNMSVFCDPLQAPPPASPTGSIVHRSSASGHEIGVHSPGVSSVPHFQLPFGHRPGSPDQYGQPPLQQQHQQQPQQQPHHLQQHQQYQHQHQQALLASPRAPYSRDQRPGSLPGHSTSLRNEIVTRKRHSSNDASDFRTDMLNPPRSVPSQGEGGQILGPKRSSSGSSLNLHGKPVVDYVSSQQHSQKDPNTNPYGVHSLLNPERRDSVSVNDQPPLQKKARNL